MDDEISRLGEANSLFSFQKGSNPDQILSFYEVLLAAGSAASGVAVGSVSVYYYSKGKSNQKKASSRPQEAPLTAQSSSSSSSPENSEAKQDSTVIDSEKTAEAQKTPIENVNPSRTIPRNELERSKRELRTLLVEKELVSAALTRLYEYEAAREITKEEREVLGARYKGELRSLDEKISKIDAFIQIGDLETLRNQLLQLVTQKIEAIEKRIDNTRKLAEPLIAEMLRRQGIAPVQKLPVVEEEEKQTKPVPDISDLLKTDEKGEQGTASPEARPVAETQAPPTMTPVISTHAPRSSLSVEDQLPSSRRKPADKVEELQKELLEALERLEKLDVETA